MNKWIARLVNNGWAVTTVQQSDQYGDSFLTSTTSIYILIFEIHFRRVVEI
jgi:hypothetical protein